RHGARDHENGVRLRSWQDAVSVPHLLLNHGDSVYLPGRGGRGGDARRVFLRLDHDLVSADGDERDGVRGQVEDTHGASLFTVVVGVLAALAEAVGLVDLCCELFGEDVVQVLTVGVLVEGGGVGEDRRAALGGGALGEDLDLAVDVDDEDGQVGEVGFGELTDVRGSNEAHSD